MPTILQTDLPPSPAAPAAKAGPAQEPDSLFERYAWLYAFCREYLFRDDTNGIAAALWPQGAPPFDGQLLVELGCGPGFYSCRFAERYHGLRVLGIDRSPQQLQRARKAARARGLDNCHFQESDALALNLANGTVDALVASRLFTVLPEREQALAEMHRVLRPGGRCFIAEPSSRLRTAVPLHVMWLLAHFMAFWGNNRLGPFREPPQAAVLPPETFGALVLTQPWRSVWRWQDSYYQYAVCEKGPADGQTAGVGTAENSGLKPEDFSI